MSKKLAILGHATRGKEVIELLEMLGGSNIHDLSGNDRYSCYFIKEFKNEICNELYTFVNENIYYFTLEEFLEKYPFKVGDKVRIPEYESEVIIDKMYWDGYEIQYEVYTDEVETYSAEELNQWNDSNKTSKDMEENKVDLTLKGELYHGNRISYQIPDGYEVSKIENGEIILIKKKPKYPTTYEECCKIMQVARPTIWFDYDDVSSISKEGDEYESHLENTLCIFRKLRICRDAYWKIAGEQMGLDKPWKPDWNHINRKFYCICNSKNNIVKNVLYSKNIILAFPTEEMRDAFYENFKNEIEQCKELL